MHKDKETDEQNVLLLDRSHNKLLIIQLNRPEARNALTSSLLKQLADTLDTVADDTNIHAVVITGNENVFAAGADLKEMAALDMLGVAQDIRPAIWKRIASFPKPIIAAVNGFALGAGCELVLHADIVIAGDNAKFGQPEINLGIIPGAGGTQRLIRAVGKSRAMKMVLSGELMDAKEALSAGLVAEVCVAALSREVAISLAKTIAAKAPLAVKQAKEVLLKSYETHLGAGLDYERKAFTILAGTQDRNEGIAAFLEKRPAHFTGK
ncbi:MAG: 2,3-dehydroadipyl-CoA hydratase [Spongiibacteraceae bacterium]|nr:2,3-dehydroadipyl-CoA hydratase [Spongiibacteraceae bacterium]